MKAKYMKTKNKEITSDKYYGEDILVVENDEFVSRNENVVIAAGFDIRGGRVKIDNPAIEDVFENNSTYTSLVTHNLKRAIRSRAKRAFKEKAKQNFILVFEHMVGILFEIKECFK